jgi:uncharacterized integral membrane protein
MVQVLWNCKFYWCSAHDMIYLLTAVGLTPSGSSTVHIYTQPIHRTTQLKHCVSTDLFAPFGMTRKLSNFIHTTDPATHWLQPPLLRDITTKEITM